MPTVANSTMYNGSSKCKRSCNKDQRQKFGSRTTASEVSKGVDLRDKTILITGTTSGIGVETARSLALSGAHVVMANRSVSASEKLRQQICEEAKQITPNIDIIQLDLSSLKSVRQAANDFISMGCPLHVLILNAGMNGLNRELNADGHERIFAVNHLGHFYFAQLLMQKLRESSPSRLVVVSSDLHAQTGISASESLDSKIQKLSNTNLQISSFRLYPNSKLCNVLFAKKAHRMEHVNGVNVYVLHPGIVRTELGREHKVISAIFSVVARPFMKTVPQGAATTVYCAAYPDLANESGKYYVNCAEAENELDKDLANDVRLQDALWETSEKLIQDFEASEK